MAAFQNCKFSTRSKQGKIGKKPAARGGRFRYNRGGHHLDLTPAEGFLSFSQRMDEIRSGFERPFWVANISELFERLSYYAAFASLARLSARNAEFSDGTGEQPGRIIRRAGVVSRCSLAARWPTGWDFGARSPSRI